LPASVAFTELQRTLSLKSASTAACTARACMGAPWLLSTRLIASTIRPCRGCLSATPPA